MTTATTATTATQTVPEITPASLKGERLRDLEDASRELHKIAREQELLPQVPARAMQPKVDAARQRVRDCRLRALQVIQVGDLDGFVRAFGVHHAFKAFRTLGISSLKALVTCTRSQFKLLARPKDLGWGAADAIPPQEDADVVASTEAVLRELNLRFREATEKKRAAALPEPVLMNERNWLDPKLRFAPDGSDFADYAHPGVVNGVMCGTKPLVEELARRGVYNWLDLTDRYERPLKESNFDYRQFRTIVYELVRRGLGFKYEDKASEVSVDAIDVDKLDKGTAQVKEVTNLSVEDKIHVRDKNRKLVYAIEVEDEFRDRVGTEADLEQSGSSSYDSVLGALDSIYDTNGTGEEEDPKPEDQEEIKQAEQQQAEMVAAQAAQTGQPAAPERGIALVSPPPAQPQPTPPAQPAPPPTQDK